MKRKTQCDAILRLLMDHRGEWVPLWKILDLHISQFGARIWTLRHELGYQIENKRHRDDEGRVRSWYRLIPGPEREPQASPDPSTEPIAAREARDR